MADEFRGERLLDPTVLASIGRLDLIARTIAEGFLIGSHQSPYHGLSQEFAEHRPYIAGDELRRIDWRVYARTDRLYVKEFEEETNAPVRLLLDVSGSLAYAPRGNNVGKLDYARYLAASLAYLANRQNDRVGLTCFADEVRTRLAARGGKKQLYAILAALDAQQASNQAHIGEVLLREAALWKRRGLALIISDLYDEPEEIVGAVARVRRARHDVIIFHLIDRAEKLLEYNGLHEFRDLETNETLMVDAGRVREGYRKRLAELCAFYAREFERAGADYAQLDTALPLDRALAVYLRRRRASGGLRA
ncbi:MAG: DUF58 domain-containing protein [Pyrinomonadaceae bacterium]